jgi:hypothetical protein
MSNLLSENSGLVTATIKPIQQTYHLVTEETLSSIKEKSIVADLLMLVTSLLFGAFFSVLITINASVGLVQETKASLEIYRWVFLVFGFLFLIMTVVTICKGNSIINSLKSTESTLITSAE